MGKTFQDLKKKPSAITTPNMVIPHAAAGARGDMGPPPMAAKVSYNRGAGAVSGGAGGLRTPLRITPPAKKPSVRAIKLPPLEGGKPSGKSVPKVPYGGAGAASRGAGGLGTVSRITPSAKKTSVRASKLPPLEGGKPSETDSASALPKEKPAASAPARQRDAEPSVTKPFAFDESVPEFMSVHPGHGTEPGQDQAIIGSVYFPPEGRIRLIHVCGPEIEKIGTVAQYIIFGGNEAEITKTGMDIYYEYLNAMDSGKTAAEYAEIMGKNLPNNVILVEDYLKTGAPGKKGGVYQMFEILLDKGQLYYHFSRGGVAGVHKALSNADNVKKIHVIVDLAERIDAAASEILKCGSIAGAKGEIERFKATVTAFQQENPYNSGPFLAEIQKNCDTIFGNETFQKANEIILSYLQAVYPQHCNWYAICRGMQIGQVIAALKSEKQIIKDIEERFKGFYRNQVLWHSGIIKQLRLPVDLTDRP